MTRGKKIVVLLPLALIVFVGAWQGLRYWWLHGYSRGTRSGIVRKVSRKGSPVCKYVSVEMVVNGTQAGQQATIWEFSVDDDGITS